MASYNKVILMGNLTRDPELRVTPKGTPICQFGLAVNRQWKNEAGEAMEEVTFIDVEAWGKQAEVIAKYLTKGRPLHLEGRLKLDQWEDKESGQKRSKLKVVLESFQFIGGKDAAPGGGEGASQPASAAPAAASSYRPRPAAGPAPARPTRPTAAPAPAPRQENLDEDVPF